MSNQNQEKIRVYRIIALLITVAIIAGLCAFFIANNLVEKRNESNGQDKDFFGKIHYNDGSIGSVETDTSDATLILERNPGAVYRAITNAGSEAVYIWPKNYTSTTTATAEVNRVGGIYLAPNGGSYEVFDNEFLWTGDIWVSSSTASQYITFVEK